MKWVTRSYRFQDGAIFFVRSFTETTLKRCDATARTWARDQGYRLVGPA